MKLVNVVNEVTMSSIDLRDLINAARKEFDEPIVENSHFLKRVEDELEGELGDTKFFRPARGGVPMRYYDLTVDQCTLVGMRESKAVRRKVLEKLKDIDQTTNLPIDNAASHFLAFKTIATAFGLKDNAQLVSANVATRKLTGFDFQNLLEIELETPDQMRYLTPTELGQTLNPPLSGQRINNLLEERGLQTKVGKTWVATDAGEKHTRLIDTGKTHSNGTMIQQMKWASTTLQNI